MTTWHASTEVLVTYATAPEAIDDVTASSVELHLLSCEACRALLAERTDAHMLEMSWDAVADRIDAPRPTPVERALRVLGLSDSYARLVGATRALQLSSLAALVLVVVGSVVLAQRTESPGPFLVIAPIVPLAAVALAFLPGADPAGEAGAAAPLTGLGLVLRRAVAVLGVALLALVLGSLALPGLDLIDVAWMLPALGLSLGALALATWVRVEVAAAALGFAWLAALWASAARQPQPITVSDLAPLAMGGQIACAALAAAAAVVLIVRRSELARLGRAIAP